MQLKLLPFSRQRDLIGPQVPRWIQISRQASHKEILQLHCDIYFTILLYYQINSHACADAPPLCHFPAFFFYFWSGAGRDERKGMARTSRWHSSCLEIRNWLTLLRWKIRCADFTDTRKGHSLADFASRKWTAYHIRRIEFSLFCEGSLKINRLKTSYHTQTVCHIYWKIVSCQITCMSDTESTRKHKAERNRY